MNRSSLFFLLMLFSFWTVKSQEVLWERTLGGRYSEYLLDMIATADNGFLIAGATQSPIGGDISSQRQSNFDGWLWKMKSNGVKEWDLRIAGDGDNFLKSVSHTAKDGGFILGLTSSSNKDNYKTCDLLGKSDAWIIKLNAARQVLWQASFGGQESEDLVKILPLKDQKYLVLINSNSIEGETKAVSYYGGTDIWVICLDEQGNTIWQKSYGGEYDDFGTDIIATNDDGYLLGGYSNSGISGNKSSVNYGNDDYWLLKIDGKGDIIW